MKNKRKQSIHQNAEFSNRYSSNYSQNSQEDKNKDLNGKSELLSRRSIAENESLESGAPQKKVKLYNRRYSAKKGVSSMVEANQGGLRTKKKGSVATHN